MRYLMVSVLIVVGLVWAYPTVDGNVDPQAEGYTLVATNPANTDKDGADLLSFYYAVSPETLYLAITTQNRASWNVAYGFSIDCAEGGYSGNPQTDTRDSWGRKLYFPEWHPDYQLYFWFVEGQGRITSANFNRYNSGNWSYGPVDVYAEKDSTGFGLQALEVAIPLASIGNPSQVKSVAYIVGGDNSSAVDILPYDSSISLTGGEEWTDWDTITTYFTLKISENNNQKVSLHPILNGVRITGNGEFVLEVYSVDGKLMATRRVNVSGSQDVFFKLRPGLYLVKEKAGRAQKFIVAK